MTFTNRSHANSWVEKIPEMRELGISGPIFISIGDEGKLAKFLDANPILFCTHLMCVTNFQTENGPPLILNGNAHVLKSDDKLPECIKM